MRNGAWARSLEKRRDIVRAAYQTIAEKGFEGLRMREIAKRAGMNHATLHYYFDGKEALVEGVLTYIVEELAIGRDAAAGTEAVGPRQQLLRYFSKVLHQMRDQPEMFIVLAEINMRSIRDSTVHSIMAKHGRGWNRFLTGIIKEGIRKREFYSDLDPALTASVIISFLRGLYMTCRGRFEDMERALRCFVRVLY